MADNENFNKLISNLSLNERHNLLQKLKSQSSISGESLHTHNFNVSSRNTETEYAKLSWFHKLGYFILSFFKAKPPTKLFEDDQVAVQGNKVEEITPGLYDYHNGLLLPLFFRLATRLKEAAHFFYSALDASVNRDRGTFFSFLGSLEMPEVHKRLQEETNMASVLEKNPEMPEAELRQTVFKAMDEAMSMVTEEHRNLMYSDARSLFCLKELSSFLYDRVLLAFSVNSAYNGETCSAAVVRELLISLNNILLSMKTSPPITLLESLFVFILQEKERENGFDFDRELRLLLNKAEEAMSVIREFNRQVPLTLILRTSTRDMSLSHKEISGGEEWFAIYRDYWRRKTEAHFTAYMKNRKQEELVESFRSFLKGQSPKILSNTQSDSNPEGLPIKGAFALSFLYTFYSTVFLPDINWILRPILIDGEFTSNENRIEFAESYNNLIKLDDEIAKLEYEISSSGEYGKRYAQGKQDMSSIPVKRRKLQLILAEVDENAEYIIGGVKDASVNMIGILNGILSGKSKGKYLALANLKKIASNSKFIDGMSESIKKFETVKTILDNIEAMENGR